MGRVAAVHTVSKMSPGYSMQFQGEPANQYKGKLDPVELTTATRSGNKKVTLINNLDTYQVFIHILHPYLLSNQIVCR